MYNIQDVAPTEIERWRSIRAAASLARPRRDALGTPLTGIFEDNKTNVRELYVDGVCFQLVSKTWVDDTGDNKPPIAVAPWGSYPEIPPKPPKK